MLYIDIYFGTFENHKNAICHFVTCHFVSFPDFFSA